MTENEDGGPRSSDGLWPAHYENISKAEDKESRDSMVINDFPVRFSVQVVLHHVQPGHCGNWLRPVGPQTHD